MSIFILKFLIKFFYIFKGRSDTTFAHIIDKMVLPRFLTPNNSSTGPNNTSNSTSLSIASASSISLSNNQNSIWLSLKDTLHLVNFVTFLSRLS
jgi:hypothetical protein